MPELPEVEHLRRSLDPVLVGARLHAVTVRRRSVVDRSGAELGDALLSGQTIVATHRRGKQMALEAGNGRALVVQLGMTGSMTIEAGVAPRGMEAKHRHVLWDFSPGNAAGPRGSTPRWRLAFRDPRRFGGLTAYASMDALHQTWSELGPDALTISASDLAAALARARRPIKAALLDQGVLAGVGNIYADESLFAARIHPLRLAAALEHAEVAELARQLRRILSAAVEQGGSTLRDYRDAFGQPGTAVQSHAAYGREGQPCLTCGTPLEGIRVIARATVFCPQCQTRCQDLSTIVGMTVPVPGGRAAARPSRRGK
jgi:formamidopyrimidine-DNA glycosylase